MNDEGDQGTWGDWGSGYERGIEKGKEFEGEGKGVLEKKDPHPKNGPRRKKGFVGRMKVGDREFFVLIPLSYVNYILVPNL